MDVWLVATGAICAYVIVTVAVGVIANRRLTPNLEDFLLYGRKTGFVILYFTVVATYHSAFAFLGSGGFFYTHGIGFWVAGSWTALVGAITYVLGSRIWTLGKRFDYFTPADMLANFYESEVVRVVVAIVSVGFTILYIQVQARGLGYILSVASGERISFELGTLILLVVAAGYLIAGGLRAVYWTDVLQGAWMYVAVWAGALVLTYKLFGGPLALWQRVAVERPDLLTVPGPEGYFTPGMWFGLMVVFSFGIIIQPHILIRYYTAVSAQTIKWLGATAAAMSTLDSILHSNMTVLTRDVYQRYITPHATPAHYILVGRVIVLGLLIVGYLLSVKTFEFLVVLVALSGAGALQLLPAILGVCFPTRHFFTRSGVLAGIGVGLATLYLTLVVIPHPLSLHGGVWSVLANFIVTISVSRCTQPPTAATVWRIHGELERFVYGDDSAPEKRS